MKEFKKLINVDPSGNFGIKGCKIKTLDSTIYGCITKLKDYESTYLQPSEVADLIYRILDAKDPKEVDCVYFKNLIIERFKA